jgi:hypothetical protein
MGTNIRTTPLIIKESIVLKLLERMFCYFEMEQSLLDFG